MILFGGVLLLLLPFTRRNKSEPLAERIRLFSLGVCSLLYLVVAYIADARLIQSPADLPLIWHLRPIALGAALGVAVSLAIGWCSRKRPTAPGQYGVVPN